jgi:hypothetical protein
VNPNTKRCTSPYLTEGRKEKLLGILKGSLYSKTGKRADNLLDLGLVHGLALLPLDSGEGGLQVRQPVQVLFVTRSDKSRKYAVRKRARFYVVVSAQQCCGSMTFWCGSGSADPCL